MNSSKAVMAPRVIAREDRRRSNAAGAHLDRRTRRVRARSDARRWAIQDQDR